MHVQTEVTIERPREDVFHRLADELGTTIPLICPQTTAVKLDPATPVAAGVTGQMTVQSLFMSAIVDFEVTQYEKGERLSLAARYRSRSSQTEYLFRDAGTGTTITTVADAPAIGPGWLQGWNQRVLERHERGDAQRLKALLEGRQKDPAKAYRRSMVRLVLIACAIGALMGAAFATYQTMTS